VLQGAAAELISQVTRRQLALGWPDLLVVSNPAYARVFPHWAGELAEAFPPGRLPARVRSNSGMTDRQWPPRTVLLPDSGYFLLREIREALEELGVQVVSVPLLERGAGAPGSRSGTKADADYADRLLQAVLQNKPDLLLTVNHLGLDRDGRLQDLLGSLRIPLAVWYVDSPEYILEDAPCVLSESSVLFCWERAWIPRLQALGHAAVTHLPLAGSPGFAREGRPARDFSLVAGSNSGALRKWRQRLDCPTRLVRELDELLESAVDFSPADLPDAELGRRLQGGAFPGLAAWLDETSLRRLASLVVLRATREDRLRLARHFLGEDFVLHGDEGWRGLLPAGRIRPPLDYYRELADHYGTVRVSLSTTSRQMPGTVNQRLFDAPLAGSAVLTDRRAELESLFEPGREVLVYDSPAEALELGRDLLRDEPARRRLVECARRRIRAEHLYVHRLSRLLETVGQVLDRKGSGGLKAFRPAAEKEIRCASW
jgi:spore maturation protein CgeB